MLEIRGQVTQTDAAARSGLTQSRISRAERGTYTLPSDEADRYARALGAPPARRRELVALCRAGEASAIRGRPQVTRRRAEVQRRIGDLERQSTLLRSWQPIVVPGLLQTWEYTLALLQQEPPTDDTWAEARRARLALLDEPGRTVRQIMSEAALRWVVGSPAVMAAQLDHLIELSRRPTIEIGVVPFGQTGVPPPEAAFHLYGDRAAVVATGVGTTFLTERPDLDGFVYTFERLSDVALFGDDAREILGRLADRCRSPRPGSRQD